VSKTRTRQLLDPRLWRGRTARHHLLPHLGIDQVLGALPFEKSLDVVSHHPEWRSTDSSVAHRCGAETTLSNFRMDRPASPPCRYTSKAAAVIRLSLRALTSAPHQHISAGSIHEVCRRLHQRQPCPLISPTVSAVVAQWTVTMSDCFISSSKSTLATPSSFIFSERHKDRMPEPWNQRPRAPGHCCRWPEPDDANGLPHSSLPRM